MWKEEIALYEQFLLFPQCFQSACFPGASKGVIVWELVKILIKGWTQIWLLVSILQVDFMSNLVNLEALLLQLKEKSVLMQDRKVGQYCIEVLHIS